VSDYAARLKGGDERASSVRSQSAERLLIGLLVAAILLALVAAAILLAPTALRVTRYELSGNASLTREELLSAALIHEKEYFFSLDAARVKSALEAEPRIADAEVTKLFPNGLRIAVRERKAVAAALVSIDGRARAVCLDAEGVAYAEASPEEAAAVPVLSGLRFEDFRVGTRLPPAVALVAASLGEIEAKEPALLSAISEIRLVRAAGPGGAAGTTELLIYPLSQRIPVRVGASLDASTLRSIILVLDVLGTRGIAASVQEIDFRTGTVVYRTKEGQPG
jgi:cell division septal protein FtsQ